MIHQLCNLEHEQIEVFFKIAIIKKSSLTYFNHLSSLDTVEDIITNLPDTADVIISEFMPEDISHRNSPRINDQGKYNAISLGFLLTPQNKNLQDLLDAYNNSEVVVLLERPSTTLLYGTPETPLLMKYEAKHSNQSQGAKGYDISIDGNVFGSPKNYEGITLNIFSRGLAFDLAGGL